MRHLILLLLLSPVSRNAAFAQETDSVSRIANSWNTPSGDVVTLHISDESYSYGDKDETAKNVLPGAILRTETIYSLEYYYESQGYGYEEAESKDDYQSEETDDFLLEVQYTQIPLEKGLQFRICSLSDSLLILHPINLKAVQFSALMQRVYLESEMETVAAYSKSYFRELNAAGKGKKRADVISKWKNNGFYADTLRLVNTFLSLEHIELDSLVWADFDPTIFNDEKIEGSIVYRDLVISVTGECRYRVVYDIIPKDDPRNIRFKTAEVKYVIPGEKSGNTETIRFLPPVTEEYDIDPVPEEPEEKEVYKLQKLNNQLYRKVEYQNGIDYYVDGYLSYDQKQTLQNELDNVHISTFTLPPHEENWKEWVIPNNQRLIIYYNHGKQRTFLIPDSDRTMALSGILSLCREITRVPPNPFGEKNTSSPYFPHSFAASPVR